MKKPLALIIALLLLLTACGQESGQEAQPQQGAEAPADNQQETAAQQGGNAGESEVYTEEGTLEDGAAYIAYRNGGPEGPLMRVEYTYENGAYGEEVYSEAGKLAKMFFKEADGTTVETTFYPSGNMEKDIITYPDGSYDETHFADNGSVDPETGYLVGGTVTYQAHVSADGQVEELISGIELLEDGTWWEIQEMENGTSRTHFGKDWKIIEDIYEDTVEGYAIVTTYHENGKQKEVTWTYTNSTEYRYTEYYESGAIKVSKYIGEDGREINYECNEEGYYTHYYDHDQYGVREYFAGENNELVKYIENDKVYEGDAITENQRNVFKQMQDMAAEVAYNMINGI